MNVIRIESLRDAKKYGDLYDVIVLDMSWGRECLGFHYNSLGLGNQITAYAGAIYLIRSIGGKKLIPFYGVQLYGVTKKIMLWWARSGFSLPSIMLTYSRLHYYIVDSDKRESFIDCKKRALHLSTHLVNIDPSYFNDIYETMDVYTLSDLCCAAGICCGEWDNEGLFYYSVRPNEALISKENIYTIIKKCEKIGVHIRRSDFTVGTVDSGYAPNKAPDLFYYKEVLEKLIDIGLTGRVLIFSDATKKEQEEFVSTFPLGVAYEFFGAFSSGKSVLKGMMSVPLLVHCNSTLSTWSSIISNQIAVCPWHETPYNAGYFFDNFLYYGEL